MFLSGTNPFGSFRISNMAYHTPQERTLLARFPALVGTRPLHLARPGNTLGLDGPPGEDRGTWRDEGARGDTVSAGS